LPSGNFSAAKILTTFLLPAGFERFMGSRLGCWVVLSLSHTRDLALSIEEGCMVMASTVSNLPTEPEMGMGSCGDELQQQFDMDLYGKEDHYAKVGAQINKQNMLPAQ
jgi:hypothetical protein